MYFISILKILKTNKNLKFRLIPINPGATNHPTVESESTVDLSNSESVYQTLAL